MMPGVAVPNVIGKSKSEAETILNGAGLTVGIARTGEHPSIAAGNVTGSSPAAGTDVDPGAAVILDVSSGPAPVATDSAIQVKVPDVTGLTRAAAETALRFMGLAVGPVKNRLSDEVPSGGAVTTNPPPGTPVAPTTAVELILSSGSRLGFLNHLPTILFAVLGITVLWLIGYIVTQDGQEFLKQLSNKEVARGLITFLIAIATVGIALILAISTLVLTEGSDGDKRFDRGKQVLSVLIGVLGTIVGFYFGAESSAPKPQTEQRVVTDSLLAGTLNSAYPTTPLDTKISTAGMKPPLTWKVTPLLPADLKFENGTISGTPKAKSKEKYKFEVTDSSAPAVVKNAELEIEIK